MSHDKLPVVLTIDDEKIIRESFRNFLEDYDYKVLEAENGRIGLEIFENKKPDLILVDLRMPEVDGLEVLEKVTDYSKNIPIIVVSGTGIISDAVEALRLGAWDYLLKPIEDMSVLLHAVEKALERSRLIRENRNYQQYLEKEVSKRTLELEAKNQELRQEISLRKKIEASLRESERKYRGYIENAPDGVFVADISGNYLEVNNAACQITGYLPEELLKMSLFNLVHSSHYKASQKYFKKVINTGHAIRDFIFIRKNSSKLHMLVETVKLSENRIMSFCKDITDRKKAEVEKARLESQLRQAQKMESIGTLAGGIAHDFNNILASILGYTELTVELVPEKSLARHNLQSVLKAGERAKELVNQILTFSRQSEQIHVPVKVYLVVKEALKLMRSSLPTTIEIHQDINEFSYVMADSTQLHQVVMNLCTNAFHAMQDQGGILSVTLSREKIKKENVKLYSDISPGDYIKLSVKDTGCGMNKKVVERIFDPYFTTKVQGKGTGLGLAVVHGIVKAHHGKIDVQTSPEKGTIFYVWLPVVENVKSEAEQIEKELIRGTEHILLVDDEQEIIQMGTQMLERLGYRVTSFTSSFQALSCFSDDPYAFDLVITDMTMPNLTGDKLAKAMIKLRKNIPIILCTGFSENINEEKANAMGIKKYIIKPVSRDTMAKAIREVL